MAYYSQNSSSASIFGPDGKLSAASAAQSLKYAKPHELPSHPIVGIDAQRSANRAASIAANNGQGDMWRYKGTDTGHSAANLAMRAQTSQPSFGVSEDGRQKALMAATMSINRGKARQSHRSPIGTPPLSSKALQATRVKRIPHMSAEMFTEHPPVEIELETKRYQDALQASALSMARQLYKLEQNKNNGVTASGKPSYPGLKEAAQQLAAERLAKLDPEGLQAYREHYGYGISMGKSGLVDDQAQASKIRGQMGQFSKALANVDESKRQQDRDNLMALAEKRVKERMRAIDQEVFEKTGHALPSISTEWEDEARAKAGDESTDKKLTTGKVHIGGSKYMDMSEVEALAAARVQPTLDEITETAQKRRVRDEEIRAAEEERKKKMAEEKAEAQKEKDEKKMREYQEKNELRQKMAVEKAERDKIRAEETAERNMRKEEERAKMYQEKNERRAKENEERSARQKVENEQKAERKRIEDEQKVARNKVEAEQRAVNAKDKAARDKTKAEERAVLERIKKEEKADRERQRAELRADRERDRAREREERLQRISNLKERQEARERLMKEEDKIQEDETATEIEAVAHDEEELGTADEDDVGGPTDVTSPFGDDAAVERSEVIETDEPVVASDASTQIKVGETTEDDVVREEMTVEGLNDDETARDIASRVFGAPVEEVVEADETTLTRAVETDDGGLKSLGEEVVVADGEVTTGTETTEIDTPVEDSTIEESTVEQPASPVVKDATPALSSTTSATPKRESRRKSFFTKLRQSIRGSGAKSASETKYTKKWEPTPAVVEPSTTDVTTEEDSTVGPGIVGASTDGTTDTANPFGNEHATEHEEEDGGLYSEPSDTTERPNEERRTEHADNVSSIYATDDADYDEARARTSTSSAERFDDARDELDTESVVTARDGTEETTHSKFQEAL